MTKTNKTLLCALLALVLTLACALTIMPTVTTVNAAEESIMLTFPGGNEKGISGYTSTWKATIGNNTWTIKNYNNNGNKWSFIKAGKKNSSGSANVDVTLAEKISMVTVN